MGLFFGFYYGDLLYAIGVLDCELEGGLGIWGNTLCLYIFKL